MTPDFTATTAITTKLIMIHRSLSSKDSYGVKINADRTHVLLQLNNSENGDQVRVGLTSYEVDDIVSLLLEEREEIKCSVEGCDCKNAADELCVEHFVELKLS